MPAADQKDLLFQDALQALADHLKAQDYEFVTPTPATHARILARRQSPPARDLRDIFGWSMAFKRTLLDGALFNRLDAAGLIEAQGEGVRSLVRASSLGAHLFFHSAYPTQDRDAVFFGPDSYRFARLIGQELARCPQREGARLVDIGTGAGVGAIVAAHLCPRMEIMATDINPAALRFAKANAQIAGVRMASFMAEDLSPIAGEIDLVFANPPYIIDEGERAYRDGGGLHGAEVSLKMAEHALPRLAPEGRFVLYTGSAIVDGHDALRLHLATMASHAGFALRYAEIDPDVFGEELEKPPYCDVERIAVVSAVIERPEPRA